MNTFSNFSTFNGCVLPGSGAWVTQNTDGNFYVDENGDLWVPCLCGGTGSTGSTGATGAIGGLGRVEEQEPEEPAEPELPAEPALPAEPFAEPESCVVFVNNPPCILWYPDRVLTVDGGRYAMGMLADRDKGGRWLYRDVHSGRLLLCVAQTNMTSRAAFRDAVDPARILLTDDDIYPGVELRCAVVFENHLDLPAQVAVRGQDSFEVAPGAREWLYLGPRGFLRGAGEQVRVAPGRGFEALLDMELTGLLAVRCCAYAEKSKIDFRGHAWPLPSRAEPSRPLDSILFAPPQTRPTEINFTSP